jgi:hypothetical protein
MRSPLASFFRALHTCVALGRWPAKLCTTLCSASYASFVGRILGHVGLSVTGLVGIVGGTSLEHGLCGLWKGWGLVGAALGATAHSAIVQPPLPMVVGVCEPHLPWRLASCALMLGALFIVCWMCFIHYAR